MSAEIAKRLFFLGLDCLDQENFIEAEIHLKNSLLLFPSRKSTLINLSISCLRQNKIDDAFKYAVEATNVDSKDANALNQLSVVLIEMKSSREALGILENVLRENPDFLDALVNKGKALYEIGKLSEAIESFDTVLSNDRTVIEAYIGIGNSLRRLKKLNEALAVYDRAFSVEQSNPILLNARGVLLQELMRFDEALTSFDKAIALKPDYPDGYNNRGNALADLKRFDEALRSYDKAIALQPRHADAWYNRGVTLQCLKRHDEAIHSYEGALALKPDDVLAEAQLLHQQQQICDFSIASKLADASARLGVTTEAVSTWLALSWLDNPKHQMLRSRKWAVEKYKHTLLPLPARSKTFPARLKIGYFSANFHNHAMLYLTAGLLREHDKKNFEVFAYSYGRSKSGDLRKKAEGYLEHFFDVTDQSDQEIVDLARSHGLDIAIDLMGYTEDTRSNIFEYRLAPVQINYLGYAGSMGADFIDYIIADPVVIPTQQRVFYTEHVIYLPHTYQPSDEARAIADRATTRSEFCLPEDVFVFCCFNNTYKISKSEFDIWMNLLRKIDKSVFWLSKSNKWAELNLRKEAELRGIDPRRLVFAEHLPAAEHLARHAHADLFVDTFNCNAHTTASDALWSGLPVVTMQGKQFAARVAASLLKSVGLPELITKTKEDYENLIFQLATEPKRLAEIKEKLARNRLKEPLFGTKRYTRNFERGLRKAYQLYCDDKPPQDIWVREDEV